MLCSISSAGTIDPNKPDAKYIEYGTKHECVLQIGGNYKVNDSDTKPFFASCVLIKPRIILTAAHVLDGAGEVFVVDNSNNKIKVIFALHLNEWNRDVFGNSDIAIGFLEEEISINFYPKLYDGDNEIGKICSISGFGITGNYIKGFSISDNKKRAGSNIIDEIFNGMLVTSVTNDRKTDLEFLIAYGDSGGGLFIDQKLAGINSGIMTDGKDKNLNSDQQDFATHTRISIHKKWIESTVEKLEEFAKQNK
jgi:hypothetical protein